jgi:hypothetical protein
VPPVELLATPASAVPPVELLATSAPAVPPVDTVTRGEHEQHLSDVRHDFDVLRAELSLAQEEWDRNKQTMVDRYKLESSINESQETLEFELRKHVDASVEKQFFILHNQLLTLREDVSQLQTRENMLHTRTEFQPEVEIVEKPVVDHATTQAIDVIRQELDSLRQNVNRWQDVQENTSLGLTEKQTKIWNQVIEHGKELENIREEIELQQAAQLPEEEISQAVEPSSASNERG